MAGRVARRVRGWPARRVGLAAVAGGLLVLAALLGNGGPLLAQDGVGIAFDDLSSYPTETGIDGFDVQLSNLDADVAYQVVVSSDNAAAVGVGACGTATQTRSVTGVTAVDLPFLVYACAVAPVTLTAEVRAAGADSVAASVSRQLTVLAFPEGAPVGVRGVPATRGAVGAATSARRPGLVPSISFDNIRIDSVRANWGLPDDGGHRLTGYGVLFWKKGTDQPDWGQAATIGVKLSHTFTGLEYDTTYRFRIHACHEVNRVPYCGIWTNPPVDVRTAGPPDPPHTIKFTNITANSVRVTWSIAANTGGVPLTGIDLRYWPYDAQNPDRETGARTHPADDGNDRGETLTGLTAGTEYELKMRACNGTNDSHCSHWSADHRFTTLAGTTPPPTPTLEPPRPQSLNVVPRAGRKAVLTWGPVAGTTKYQVQAQILGQTDWYGARCEGVSAGQPSQPKCVIDLEYIAKPGGKAVGLQHHKAYALQVQVVKPQEGEFSAPIVIIDTPIFMAKGASRSAKVTWTPVETVHSDLRAGGSYQLRYRKFKGDHSSVAWKATAEAFDPTTPTPDLPSGTTSHPIGNLDNYGLYAIQLLYNAPRTNAAPIRVFAARDAYVWPSDRAAGVDTDPDGTPYAGERVGTFPLSKPVGNRTYAYYICSDTFPRDMEPDEPDDPDPPDGIRAKSRAFIQDAFAQWETATTTETDTSLITMKYMGTTCANYRPLIQPIVNEINANVIVGLPHEEIEDNVEAVTQQLGDLTGFLDQDKERSEVIFVDVPVEDGIGSRRTKRYVYFSEVSHRIGINECVFTSLACAANEEKDSQLTTDILINGKSFENNEYFNWDIPSVAFNQCISVSGSDIDTARSLYLTTVHEAGHALGIRGTSARSRGTKDQIHHSQVEDSVMKARGADICSPTPFDVMAIYALYQTQE